MFSCEEFHPSKSSFGDLKIVRNKSSARLNTDKFTFASSASFASSALLTFEFFSACDEFSRAAKGGCGP
ncbi:MAG: hypothetical protein DMG65_26715 [Candidatus Angelobacter sp. Gp1-AA117]|nr:MAG: hypothetical protein DMG65_26715 [Candidatus Angelobacter sp. Gp1-AA117]